MELSDDAKAIVASNLINAAAAIQLASSYNGHGKSIESCVKVAVESYIELLKTI